MDEIILRNALRRQALGEASARKAEESLRSLSVDLSHRVNNAVTIIGSMVRHSLRTADSLPEAARAVEGRVRALFSAHDLMNRNAQAETWLVGIVRSALTQFGRAASSISLKGEDVTLPSRLALLFDRSRARQQRDQARRSPLTRRKGSWKVLAGTEETRQLVFLWTEEGGPPVDRPKRLGFGTTLIRRLAQAQNVIVRIDYRPAGLRRLLRAPLTERAQIHHRRE
jgi:two-component sensor histidine kinase